MEKDDTTKAGQPLLDDPSETIQKVDDTETVSATVMTTQNNEDGDDYQRM